MFKETVSSYHFLLAILFSAIGPCGLIFHCQPNWNECLPFLSVLRTTVHQLTGYTQSSLEPTMSEKLLQKSNSESRLEFANKNRFEQHLKNIETYM